VRKSAEEGSATYFEPIDWLVGSDYRPNQSVI